MGAFTKETTETKHSTTAATRSVKTAVAVEKTLEANLNRLLANEYTLFTKTLKYHWNVTGERFYSIHEFLETQYKTLLTTIDDLAERVREIRGFPIATMTEFKERTDIVEHPGSNPEASMMLVDLLQDHDLIRSQIQEILESKERFRMQASTEDFLIGMLKSHDEMAWMLRSSLN